MSDEYEVTVTFKRYLSDDQEVATRRHPNKPLEKALQSQLRDELQAAYLGDHGLAGFFEVEEIKLT